MTFARPDRAGACGRVTRASRAKPAPTGHDGHGHGGHGHDGGYGSVGAGLGAEGAVTRPRTVALAASLVACALLGIGCTKSTHDAARLGDYPLDDAAVARFVRYATGLDPAQVDAAARRRYAEDLLAETLIARAAERDRIQPAPEDLARAAADCEGALAGTAAPDAIRVDARRRALAATYEARVLWPRVVVSEREVEARAAAPIGTAPSDTVVFRAARFEERAEADRAKKKLGSGATFESLVAGGARNRPTRRRLAELPPEAAAALTAARPGSTTGPVALDGAYYLFRLESKGGAGAVSRPADREAARRELRQRAFDTLRRELAVALARTERVPFPAPDPPEEVKR